MILQGDCLERLKELPDNSVDSIVSDPPYGLSFMGKKWDYDVPSVAIWKEAIRVLKPGGHLLAFGGTRTYHRLVVNIEDAGFEIRDQVMWIYGSGFPKSMDISKQIDKQAGAKREVIGKKPHLGRKNGDASHESWANNGKSAGADYCTKSKTLGVGDLTIPATDLAKQWQGWGTALKPANEPICVARKPIEKGLTVAENVIKWGVGGLNIDESRIGTSGATKRSEQAPYAESGWRTGHEVVELNQGRWPANVIFDEEAAQELDQQSGTLKSGSLAPGHKRGVGSGNSLTSNGGVIQKHYGNDSGGASRFFYVAKASRRERNAGLEGMPSKQASGLPMRKAGGEREGQGIDGTPTDRTTQNQNFHPTVKPIKLMEYLIKLVTPKGGTVLDPFTGSGSTGVAAKKLGFKFIGCELNAEYVEIAQKRIASVEVSA